jgi:hypothetical protein
MGYFAAAVVEEAGPVTDVLSIFHDRAAHSQTPERVGGTICLTT